MYATLAPRSPLAYNTPPQSSPTNTPQHVRWPPSTHEVTFAGIIVTRRVPHEVTFMALFVPRHVLADFSTPATPPLEMTKAR